VPGPDLVQYELQTVSQRGIVGGAGEETIPVLPPPVQVVQPVAYVGDNAVDVEHRQAHRPPADHVADRGTSALITNQPNLHA
jgi:hypothetical protein